MMSLIKVLIENLKPILEYLLEVQVNISPGTESWNPETSKTCI